MLFSHCNMAFMLFISNYTFMNLLKEMFFPMSEVLISFAF